MDEATRAVIDHGRRIRACLKQPEFQPVAVPVQIAILLALGGKLFDLVPLEKMEDAERAVCVEAAKLPGELNARLEGGEEMRDADRKTVMDMARAALEPFRAKPEAKPEAQAPQPAEKP